VFVQEGLCVGVVPGFVFVLVVERLVEEEADNAFVGAVEGLKVGFVVVGGAPDGNVGDEVGVCKHVVEGYEGGGGEEFVDVPECLDEGLEFFDGVCDVVVEVEVVVEDEAEEFCVGFLFERDVVDGEGYVRVGAEVKDGIGCFGGVWNEVVVVEVGGESVEIVLRVVGEGLDVREGEDEGGVVGVGEDGAEADGGTDVVDVEEEERGGEGGALGDAVGDEEGVGGGVLGVERLDAVGEVGAEDGDGVGMEVEVVEKFVEEFGVGDGVVGFGEIEVDGEGGNFALFVVDDVVEDVGEGKGGVGVGAEGICGRRKNVVGKEVVHELVVDDFVEDFADDGEQGDGAVVLWKV
jgi:hypothetical protein